MTPHSSTATLRSAQETLNGRPLTRAEIECEQRQRAYAEQLAAKAAVWWLYVSARYAVRLDRFVAAAILATDIGDLTAYRRCARRARRWRRIIRWLDGAPPAELLKRYQRVISRPDVHGIVKSLQTVSPEEFAALAAKDDRRAIERRIFGVTR